LNDSFEIPKKGVKIYSPEDGWSDQLESSTKESSNVDQLKSTSKDLDTPIDDNNSNSTLENSSNPNIVAVGDALEQLFDTLNNSSIVENSHNSPTWKDVAELSRQLEEKLDQRKDVLEKLSMIDEDLQLTRKELLSTLKKLGKFENDQLSAATVRASVSAMAIEVLEKKLS
jgi:CII-binding regulator of phage lambda lysogenization HflD